MYRDITENKKNYFRTINSLYDIVCMQLTIVIMIVPFLI